MHKGTIVTKAEIWIAQFCKKKASYLKQHHNYIIKTHIYLKMGYNAVTGYNVFEYMRYNELAS